MPSACSSHPIYLVCGDKGGVGKSMVSLALLHHLAQRGTALLFIETDTSNPDVWRCHEQEPGIVSRSIVTIRPRSSRPSGPARSWSCR